MSGWKNFNDFSTEKTAIVTENNCVVNDDIVVTRVIRDKITHLHKGRKVGGKNTLGPFFVDYNHFHMNFLKREVIARFFWQKNGLTCPQFWQGVNPFYW